MQETDVAELHLLEVLMGPVRLCWSKPVQTVKPTCGIPLSSLSGPRIAQSLLSRLHLLTVPFLQPQLTQLPHVHWQDQDKSAYYMGPIE